MRTIRITKNNFDEFYNLLEQDFCFEERKTKEDELKTLSNKNFRPKFILRGNEKIGYICYWEFDEFVYIEHLAIKKEDRNNGYGTTFLKAFIEKQTKPIIIEVERPIDELTTRRINFYKRIGFCVNKFDYHQPSYHNGSDSVPMHILTYGKPVTQSTYNKSIKIIKQNVYGLN